MSPRRDEFEGAPPDPLMESSGPQPKVPLGPDQKLRLPHVRKDAQGVSRWTLSTPAKINLFLKIVGRRPDGFHALQTLMTPVSVFDTLTLTLPDDAGPESKSHESQDHKSQDNEDLASIRLKVIDCRSDRTSANNAAPAGEDNLVLRALRLLQEHTSCNAVADVTLYKRIPSQAGLGGGSSDAAAALLLGNAAWGLNLEYAQLSQLAGRLGSDVPFFLTDGAAFCTGRGEIIRPVELPGGVAGVIAKPPVGLSTPEVFGRLNAPEASPQELAAAIKTNCQEEKSSWELAQSLRQAAYDSKTLQPGNDLQPPAEEATPWIGRLKQAFAALPFDTHQMSGSGSAYFGICRSRKLAQRLANTLRQQGCGWVQAISTC